MRRFAWLAVLIIAFCIAYGQSTNGSITGRVTDASKAVLVGANVIAINTDKDTEVSVLTDGSGSYHFASLLPGNYRIEVEKQNFRTVIKPAVVVHVQDALEINFEMAVGATSESVTVKGGAPVVDTRTSTLGDVVEQERIISLPLNGRDFLQLAVLQPGVTPSPGIGLSGSDKASVGADASSFSANGLRGQSNRFLLDGANDSNPSINNAMSIPAPDAIAEFRVLTNMYSAEFGSGGGAIVNVATKSGANSFHGSVYEFLRNNIFDAQGYFARSKEDLRRNQFGGSFGGPIIKNKTFFFGSYEGFRERRGDTLVTTVPSLRERTGDFSQSSVEPINFLTGQPFPNDMVPVDPVSQKVLALIPKPNVGANGFSESPILSTNRDQFMTRVDHRITANDDLFARYFYETSQIIDPFPDFFGGTISLPGFGEIVPSRFHHAVLSENHAISPSTLNEFQFAYMRSNLTRGVPQTPYNYSDFGFTFPKLVPDKKFPAIAIPGYMNLGAPDATSSAVNNLFQVQDNLSKEIGKHSLKFGGDFTRIQNNRFADLLVSGAYEFSGAATGNPLADFILGQPLIFFLGGGLPNRAWRRSLYNVYAQDTYQVRANLSLNLGIRYELGIPWSENSGKEFNFIPGAGESTVRPDAPTGLLFKGDPGFGGHIYQTDKTAFAPRFGFAWAPAGNGTTSVRGGFGVFYDDVAGINILDIFHSDPRYYQVLGTVFGGSFSNPFHSDPFSSLDPVKGFSAIAPGQVGRAFQPNFRTPYVFQYNLTIQRSLAQEFLFQIGYVGTKATKLPGIKELNPATFIPGQSTPFNVDQRRPFAPAFGSIFYDTGEYNSNYNSLQTSVEKRFSHGYYLQAAYTYSKAIDFNSVSNQFLVISGQPTMPQNPRDIEAERGDAAYDVPHRFVFNFVWEPPYLQHRGGAFGPVVANWQFAGILTFQSGFPFTVIDSADPNLDGVPDRPNLVGDPNAGTRTLNRWFNVAAFAPLAIGTNAFGDAGRNILRSGSTKQFDLAAMKNFPFRRVSESFALQFRADFFNLFNTPTFAAPVNDIRSVDFGRVINTANTPREIQLALKLSF